MLVSRPFLLKSVWRFEILGYICSSGTGSIRRSLLRTCCKTHVPRRTARLQSRRRAAAATAEGNRPTSLKGWARQVGGLRVGRALQRFQASHSSGSTAVFLVKAPVQVRSSGRSPCRCWLSFRITHLSFHVLLLYHTTENTRQFEWLNITRVQVWWRTVCSTDCGTVQQSLFSCLDPWERSLQPAWRG